MGNLDGSVLRRSVLQGARWIATAIAFVACAAPRAGEAERSGLPRLEARAAPGVHASIVWEGPDLEALAVCMERIPWADWSAKHGGRIELCAARAFVIDFETSVEDLPNALGLVAQGLQAAATARETKGVDSPMLRELGKATAPWNRLRLLGAGESANVNARSRWHASALARPVDFAAVERAFSELERHGEGRDYAPTPTAASLFSGKRAGALLFDSRASLPTELRWIPNTEFAADVPADVRAQACVRAAASARQVSGWTFVPACLDAFGRREPAHLYTSGDFASVKSRLDGLRVALKAPLGPELVRSVREELVNFARAQSAQESFRLRALHGSDRAVFEADRIALEQLLESKAAAATNPQGIWSVRGPRLAWQAELAQLGPVEIVEPPDGARAVVPADADLDRLWNSVGGAQRWRELDSLHLLGVLTPEDGTRQGVEQWADFTTGQFALSQAIGPRETVIAANASEAWILDDAKGIDLEPAQARKFRARQERAWFAVLRRLAQPNHDGLTVVREQEKLLLLEGPRALCWIEIDDAGNLCKLGYRLDEHDDEALYEFQDWKPDGPLPYPARTLQLDRKATFDLQHLEANVKLDPSLWNRGQR